MLLELGKCKTYIQAITSGKSLPSFDAFFDLCDFFEITPAEFFTSDKESSAAILHTCRKLDRISADDLALVNDLLDRLDSHSNEDGCNEA